MTIEAVLIDLWKWDKKFPAYQAFKNPKNLVEKCLQIHERVEYELLEKYYYLEAVDTPKFYKLYQKAHAKANKAMILYLKERIELLAEPQFRNVAIKNVLMYIWKKYYPINQQEKDYLSAKNTPQIKTQKEGIIFNVIYFYIKDNENLNEIKGY